MFFNYFRIFLTILISFSAFFCYACRFNLSQTINDMVIDDSVIEFSSAISGQDHQIEESFNLPRSIYLNEEHAFSLMSKSVRKISQLYKTNQEHRVTQRSSRKSRAVIEFDIRNTNSSTSDGASTSKSMDNKVSTETPQATNSSSSVDEVVIKPKNVSNLLKWSKSNREFLLSAFFIGYVLSQIPGARAAEMFGAKLLFLIAGFGSSLCSLVFPFAANCSIIFAYFVRFLMGFTQGALFPAIYVFLCEWLPSSERSNWLPLPSAFSRFGTIVMYSLVPITMKKFGWEAVFYFSGVTTLIWCILFIIFGSNSPNQSYWISKEELIYIESHMEPRVGSLTNQSNITASGFTINESGNETLRKPSVNWVKIVTNKPILILSLVMFTSEWNNMLLLVQLTSFLGPVFNMPIDEICWWSSVLVGIYCVQYPLSGFCASRLEAAKIDWLTSIRVRKIFELAAHAMQAIGCFMIAFSRNKIVVLSALSLMMFGRGTVGGGQCLIPPELSKEYSGTVFAFANTLANTANVIGPNILPWLVHQDRKSHGSWFSLWFLSGFIFVVGGLVFCLFAENRPQNYCRKSRTKQANNSLSLAQLTIKQDPDEIFTMDAFSHVAANEPNQTITPEHQHEE